MNAPTKASLYVVYLAVVAAVLPYVAYFGIQPQGFHSNPKFFGWVMPEWFRVPFAYVVFAAALVAIIAAVVALFQRKLTLLPLMALLLGVGFLAYEWSPFTDVACRAVGAGPGCLP